MAESYVPKPFSPGCNAQLFSCFTIQFCFPACTPQPTTSPKPKKNSKKNLESDAALSLVDDGPDEDASGNDIDKLIDWSNASPCPYPSLAFPMFSFPESRAAGIAYDFECLDLSSDLDNCGGCSSLGDNSKCLAPSPLAR